MSRKAAVRVLLLTPSLEGGDGIAEVSRQAAAACASEFGGHNVEIWALRGGNSGVGHSARFRSADGRRSRLAAWALAQAARPVDDLLVVLLHLHLAPVSVPIVLRGASLACFLHGIEAWQPLRPRERAGLAGAHLVANSAWTARKFTEANPAFRTTDVAVCPLGVGPAAAPEDPGLKGYALIVGRMAANERYKGHDVLIDVWPRVRQHVPYARLVIAGDGDDRVRLEARAAASAAADAIVFTKSVSNAAREGLYRDAAFFVMPSTGEGFGLAYLEAMRAGKACIAAPGAAAEIIRDGVEGLLVDPASPDAVAAAIVRLFSDGELRERMGNCAARRVANEFESGHFAGRLVAELHHAVERAHLTPSPLHPFTQW